MKEKFKSFKASYKKYILFFAIVVFLIGLAISYAYLEVSSANTSNPSNFGVSLECMDIAYSESNIIDLDYSYPVSDSYALKNVTPVTITITNNCGSASNINYTLAISSLYNATGFIGDDQIRMKTDRTMPNDEEKVIRTPMYMNMLEEMPKTNALVALNKDLKTRENASAYQNTSSYIIDSNTIDKGETITYKIYLWIDYYEGDISKTGLRNNSTEGKTFAAAISIITNDDLHDLGLGEAYALYTENNKTLSFVRSEIPINVGDTHSGEPITNVYTGFENSTTVPWSSKLTSIENVDFIDEIRPTSTADWFYEMGSYRQSQPLTIDVTNLNTSLVTDMSYMFYNEREINTINIIGLENWDVSNVTNMSNMFYRYGSNPLNIDLSNWDVSNVTNMSYMFCGNTINTNIGVSSWDTSSVTNMSYMFMDASINTDIGISNWDVSSVIDMTYMFLGTNLSVDIDLSNWDVSKVAYYYSFNEDIRGTGTLTLPTWKNLYFGVYSEDDYSLRIYNDLNIPTDGDEYEGRTATKVYNMSTTPNNRPVSCSSTIAPTSIIVEDNIIAPSSTNYWFAFCTKVNKIDVSKLNTSNVNQMSQMFDSVGSDSSVTKMTIIGIDSFNTSSVTWMGHVFRNFGLNATYTLDLRSWDVSKVTGYSGFNNGVTNKVMAPIWPV